MKKHTFCWQLGYTSEHDQIPITWFPACVPGAVQLDYAKANDWPPYYKGMNYEDYGWMEDVFWHYRAALDFTLDKNQCATLVFGGIDYRYEIRVGDTLLCEGEGMFTPVRCDVSRFAGQSTEVDVLIYPCPKADDSGTRDQARKSCKAAACYGWDWHPRLISLGIWDDAYLLIQDKQAVSDMDVTYRLNEELDRCDITVTAYTAADCRLAIRVMDGAHVVTNTEGLVSNGIGRFVLTVENPKLWYPVGYGDHPLYMISACSLDEQGNVLAEYSRKVGFRRSKLVMNAGGWRVPVFPKSRAAAPATLEINGVRVFAKGSNWVNAQIFPGQMDEALYSRLLNQVKNCNMNILRIWGGGFVNKESFFEICDELGIMIWQEFPLACNEYPDEDDYLAVLEKEAKGIIRRLRTHPCVVMWCGGNELFNSWSGMTEQHHALRLLDSICYQEDRFTPFIMTSPLNGMAHGHYFNYDENTGEEFITRLIQSNNTAYTEFGCPGMSSVKELQLFLSEEDLDDCNPENKNWVAHHGFKAWLTNSWVRKTEVEYYFGGFSDLKDLVNKTQFIQAMCYRSMFEEARRQWPFCSMAINWCLNEPWPVAGNNSLIHWSGSLKPAYHSVSLALRERIASARVSKHLWWGGETFSAEIWLINDALVPLENCRVKVSYCLDNETIVEWGSLFCTAVSAQNNCNLGTMSFVLPADYSGIIKLILQVEGYPEMDSEYTYLCRCKQTSSATRILNI